MPGKRQNYSPEFKEEAARLVVDSSRPIAHVAREIGVHDVTLGYWVKLTGKSTPKKSRRWTCPSGRGFASLSGKTASSR